MSASTECRRLRLIECAWLFVLATLVRWVFALVSIGQLGSEDAVRHLSRDTEHYTEAASTLQHEHTLQSTGVRLFGPGYPILLTGLEAAGGGVRTTLCVQTLLASLGAVLIALLAFHITSDRRIALIAGVLHALSLSALGHSTAFMGDALGLVLLTAGLFLFCRAVVGHSVALSVGAGLLLGLSTLTSLFVTPLILAVPVLAAARPARPEETWQQTLRSRWKLVGVALTSMLILPSFWIAHNRAVYGVYYLRQIEAVNMIRSASAFRLYQDGTPFETSMAAAGDSIQALSARLGNEHRAFEVVAYRALADALARGPVTCAVVYVGTIDDNVNTDDGVWQSQLPMWGQAIETWKVVSERYLLRFRMFLLCLAGAWILWRRGDRRALWVLTGLFVLFAASAGVSPWQGNRLFYPGQVASLPLVAVVLGAGLDRLLHLARRNPR